MALNNPPRFDGETDYATWKLLFENYMAVHDLEEIVLAGDRGNLPVFDERQQRRKRQLLLALDPKVVSNLNGIMCGSLSAALAADVWRALDGFYSPQQNALTARFLFASYRMKPGQRFAEAMSELRSRASRCNFNADHVADQPAHLLNCRLRDQAVIMLSNEETRARLLREQNLTLTQLEEICLRDEQAQADLQLFSHTAPAGGTAAEVHVFSSGQRGKGTFFPGGVPRGRYPDRQKPQQPAFNTGRRNGCWRCGRNDHTPDTCGVLQKQIRCFKCDKLGHLARCCSTQSMQARMHEFGAEGDSPDEEGELHEVAEDSLELLALSMHRSSAHVDDDAPGGIPPPKYFMSVFVNGKQLNMQLDTGAQVSVIGLDSWQKLGYPKLVPTKRTGHAYNGKLVPLKGKINAHVTIATRDEGRVTKRVPLYVAELDVSTPTLGLAWLPFFHLDWSQIQEHVEGGFVRYSKQPQLQYRSTEPDNHTSMQGRTDVDSLDIKHKLELLLEEYSDLFDGKLGCVKNAQCTLRLKNSPLPKSFAPRPLAYALVPKVEAEIERLRRLGIIKPISELGEPAACLTPIVPILKENGELRICGDYKVTLNPCLDFTQHPMPRTQDLFAKIGATKGDGAKRRKFTKLDFADAFLQIRMHPESQKYVVINTHIGQFYYTRMPFGIACAPSIQQATADYLVQGLQGVVCFVDDLCVTGEDDHDHLRNLKALFERLRQFGVKLAKKKCDFMKDYIKFLGFIIDSTGTFPNEDKIRAVIKCPAPKDTSGVRSFLGMVNQYANYITDLVNKAAPLYKLEKKDVNFEWTDECQKAFDILKQDLTAAPVLVHYNPKLPLGLVTDASGKGIGAKLFHKMPDGSERPIAYASRTLSSAEANYSQIEREALAIYYGIRKFHPYLYGRHFYLYTDHQPLTTIFGETKGLPQTSTNRLQRWAIFMSGYQYNVEYRRSKDVAVADALSRLPLPLNAAEEAAEDDLFELCAIDWPNRPVDAKEIARATSQDATLGTIMRYALNGWPEISNAKLTNYFEKRHQITVDQGCVLWGSRVIIPAKLRDTILAELHDGHPGISRMKGLARFYVYWPHMDRE